MRRRALTPLPLAALAVLTPLSPSAAAAEPADSHLELYSGPGLGHTTLAVASGCHSFAPRMVYYADSTPVADYTFHSGPDCTGAALGSGQDATQWIPPLSGVRSVRIVFHGAGG
ncbi:hypothetical protein [Salinactinospora qingdaonensis]|uniref:Secreted protein n=1 Tax=Salinactinospora qingdaonensis TaxID=702744 RepID=A0ABP7GEX6_9ACTN